MSIPLGTIKRILMNSKINFIDLDGIKHISCFGWWLIRASNTEDKITIKYGSMKIYYLYFILLYLSNILHKVGLKADFFSKAICKE